MAWELPAGAVHDQEVLSAPALHLTVEGDAIELHGVVTRRFVRQLRGSGRVLGCRFRPGGLVAACRLPVAAVVDQTRQRICDALAQAEAGRADWALLATELGFVDQPHLSRVFRELVGMSPAAYERRVPT